MANKQHKIKFKGTAMAWNFKGNWPEGDTRTQNWLANQALWHDSDMMLALAFGFAIGVCIGYIL